MQIAECPFEKIPPVVGPETDFAFELDDGALGQVGLQSISFLTSTYQMWYMPGTEKFTHRNLREMRKLLDEWFDFSGATVYATANSVSACRFLIFFGFEPDMQSMYLTEKSVFVRRAKHGS